MSELLSDVSTYRSSLSGDIAKRYDDKIAVIEVDPYSLGKDDFKSDRNSWPSVTNMDIIQFFVFRNSAYSQQQLRNYKSLDAYRYFQDGWVQNIAHKEFKNGTHLIKAKVNHSMRIREKPLDPWIIFNNDGIIESAHCTCMAGLGECCSHIGVLFAMETSTKIRDESSVTDVPAYWLFPGGSNFYKPFKRIREMDFQSANKKRKEQIKVTCTSSSNPVENIPSPTEHEEKLFFFEELAQAIPNSAVLSLTDKFSETFVPKAACIQAPEPLSMLLDTSIDPHATESTHIDAKCENITSSLTITKDQVEFVEKSRKDQADSTMWYQQRCGRITASKFHTVCHTKLEKPSLSLLKQITCSKKVTLNSPAIDWGRKMRDVQRKCIKRKLGQCTAISN